MILTVSKDDLRDIRDVFYSRKLEILRRYGEGTAPAWYKDTIIRVCNKMIRKLNAALKRTYGDNFNGSHYLR